MVITAGAKAVAAGAFHSMVIKEDGSVWATGSNEYGQLGVNGTKSAKTFLRLTEFSDGTANKHAIMSVSLRPAIMQAREIIATINC